MAVCFSVAAYFVSTTALAANRSARAVAAALDKLCTPEEQSSAGETTGPTGAARQSQGNATPSADRSQWRKLRRHISRDEVRKLLGEPDRISVSRFYESWEYLGGSVTFDGKGHVDFWSEP